MQNWYFLLPGNWLLFALVVVDEVGFLGLTTT